MHHAALAVHPAQDAHGQAGIPHCPHPSAVHEKTRSRPGLEEPCRAGVEIHTHQVQRSAALILTFQRQRHIHQPRRQFCRKPSLQQPGGKLCRKVPVHRRRPPGAHAVAQDHLRRSRAAELLHCVAGNAPPRRRTGCAEHHSQRWLFAEEQSRQPFAGEHLRHFQRAAADAPHLLRKGRQLLPGEPGARQRDRRMGAPQVIQRHRTLLRGRTQRRKKVCHPA